MVRSRPAQRNRLLLTAIIMLSMLAIVMLAFAYHAKGEDGDATMPTPSVPTHDLAVIASGEATKTALDGQEDAQQQSAIATAIKSDQIGLPNPKNPNSSPATPIPMPIATVLAQTLPRTSDGIDIIQSALRGSTNLYQFTNMWSGTVNTNQVFLFAGSKTDNTGDGTGPAQGVIVYSTMGVSADAEYLTATKHGTLTFIDASGKCLTLTATDRTEFTFDASNHTWSCTP